MTDEIKPTHQDPYAVPSLDAGTDTDAPDFAPPPRRRYGRRIPFPLPPHRMLSHVASVPPVQDLRPWGGPVKDQGSEGSCTAHAGSSAVEWIFRRYFAHVQPPPILSPQYLYACELLRQGDFPQDDGSDGLTLCESLVLNGVCPEADYPYTPGLITRPRDEQRQAAQPFTLGAYHGITSAAVALTVLGDPVPWPVLLGFTVYQSFESEVVARTGVVPLPRPGEPVLGGHEVLCLGYDIGMVPSIRPPMTPPSVLVQNSWGPGWGVGGFFWMPVEVLDRPDSDMKIAHSGHPWAAKQG